MFTSEYWSAFKLSSLQIKSPCSIGLLHLLHLADIIWPDARSSVVLASAPCRWPKLRNVVVGIIVENTLAAAQAKKR